MGLGRLLSILGFLFALACLLTSVIFFLRDRGRAARVDAARECTAEQIAKVDWRSCWAELPAAVASKDGGRVELETRWNNLPLTVGVTLDDGAAAKLAPGAQVTARLMEARVLLVRTPDAELRPADGYASTWRDQVLSVAVFGGVALLLGFHLLTHKPAPGRVDGLGVLLAAVGIPTTIALPILSATRGSEAAAYAKAPPCAGAEQPGCRFSATGHVVATRCAHSGSFNDTHCDLTFDVDGAPQPERRVCSFQRDVADKVAAARVARLELWNGTCTGVELGGQAVPLLSTPRSASGALAGGAAASFWLAAIGVYRIIRRRRSGATARNAMSSSSS